MRVNKYQGLLLPEGHDDILPPLAQTVDAKRRALLDAFYHWGYDYVMPPLIEYPENICREEVTSNRQDEREQMLHLVDPASGRQLAMRSDMTLQTVRMDAYRMNSEVNRLCYLDWVIRPHPVSAGSSRSFIQFGAEIFEPTARLTSNIEIICLSAECARILDVREELHLCLSHAGLLQELMELAGLLPQQMPVLIQCINAKAKHEVIRYLSKLSRPPKVIEWFVQLIDLYGDADTLSAAMKIYGQLSTEIRRIIEILKKAADNIQRRGVQSISFDLAEHPGSRYEIGMVFAFYALGAGRPLLQGGCYTVTALQGKNKNRSAVGFSGDLKAILQASDGEENRSSASSPTQQFVFAEYSTDPEVDAQCRKLCQQGYRVFRQFDRESKMLEIKKCRFCLSANKGKWKLIENPEYSPNSP